jgi:hypothetical protein
MEPIGAELERLLAPVIVAARVELEGLARSGGGCRTSFAQIVIRNPDGSVSARCYASAGPICSPGEVIFHADTAAEAFQGAFARLAQKAAESRETAARLEELRRAAGELGYELVKQED